MRVSGFMNVKVAIPCYARKPAIVVFFVLMALFPALLYKKAIITAVIELP
jgi:hypothetical protein